MRTSPATDTIEPGPGGDQGPVRWTLLFALFLGPFIAMLDLSIVTVALPAIQSSLHAEMSSLQWVVDAYTLALSSLLLSAGSLGDRYGRKRLYLAGMAVFTLGSAVCAAAPSTGVLIAGRALQGAGATSLIPGSLSLLTQAFPDPRRRARMVGLWGAVGGLAVAAGPVLGGILVESVGWSAIFVINVPIGAAALLLGARSLTESRQEAKVGSDPAGQIAVIVWLASLTFALVASGSHGWSSPYTLVPLALSVAACAAFLLVESRVCDPMLPLQLFTRPLFALSNLASFVLGFGAYSVFIYLSVFLQRVQGYTALGAGVRFLPLCLAITSMSIMAGRLTARIGPLRAMTLGFALTGAGLLLVATFASGTAYVSVAAVLVVLGTGMGLTIAPVTAAAMSSVERDRSGVASGTVNAIRQAGTTLGIAVLGSMITATAIDRVERGLTSAHGIADEPARLLATRIVAHQGTWVGEVPPGPAAARIMYDAGFTDGLRLAVLVAGLLTLSIVLLTILALVRAAGDDATRP